MALTLDVFDGADFIQRDGARSGDGAAGFDDQPGNRQTDGRRFVAHDGAQLGGEFAHRRRVVGRQIRDTQAATEIDGRDLRGLVDPELGDDVAQQADDPVRGEFEAGDIEDLRPDVAVQTDQSQVIGGEYPPHRSHRRAAGHRQPELLVFVGGGDELVGVRFDADGDADQHVLDDTRLTGDGVESLDLDHRIQHDVADTGFDRGGQLGDRFVVAVQRDSLGREVRVQRDGQFAAGADVEREAFFVDPSRYLAAQECLGGVVHVGSAAERRGDLAAARAEVVLVDDEQRRAVLLREPVQRDAGNADNSVVVADGVAGPDIRRQLQQFFAATAGRGGVPA